MIDDFKPYRPQPAYVPVTADPELNTHNFADEPQFVPPGVVASRENLDELPAPQPNAPKQKPAKSRKSGGWNPKNWSRKTIIVTSAVIGVMIAAGLVWYTTFREKPAPPPPPPAPIAKEEKPAPTTVPDRLTGVQIKPEQDKMPLTAIMIENSPDARPQSGLYYAGVVFEAIAEGGITRFMTIFHTEKPEYIGPVRSVRPYYLDFLAAFDAPIAHAGGSAVALGRLRAEGFKDLEAFQNPAYYQRVSSRYAPHNLYTGRSRLLELQKKKGWTTSNFKGFDRKEEKPRGTPNVKSITLNISGYYYDPTFVYDPVNNSYLRKITGAYHKDEKAKKTINPKVVVVLVMSHHYAAGYSVYGTLGTGRAYIFQDGGITEAKWVKNKRTSQLRFYDDNGNKLGLNPGQTWISLVSSKSEVKFK